MEFALEKPFTPVQRFCFLVFATNKAAAFRVLRDRYHCHLIAAAETSATQPVQKMVRQQMRHMGYFSAFTTAAPALRARADQQISKRGKATGCACFCLSPMRQPRSPQLINPGMDLRMLHVVIEAWNLQIITVYGLSQSNTGAQEFNDDLLALAAQRVKQVHLPAIILGDFNSDVSRLTASGTLASMGCLHLQQMYSAM